MTIAESARRAAAHLRFRRADADDARGLVAARRDAARAIRSRSAIAGSARGATRCCASSSFASYARTLRPPRAHGRGRLVVSNHRGVADVLVLLSVFGGRMVSRADLSRWPLIGLAGRKLGTVFVDRADLRSGAATIRAMRELLARGREHHDFSRGHDVRGRRGAHVPRGRALRCGGHAGAEIVPVGLAYSRDSQAAFLDESFPSHLSRMAAAPPSFVAIVDRRAARDAGKDLAAQDFAERSRVKPSRAKSRVRAKKRTATIGLESAAADHVHDLEHVAVDDVASSRARRAERSRD